MKATSFEFRFRVVIIVAIVWLGFEAPWIEYLHIGSRIGLIEWLALGLSRVGLATFTVATPIVIVSGALIAALGAAIRPLGHRIPSQPLPSSTVKCKPAPSWPAGLSLRPRNPLYIGLWLTIAAMTFIMTPSGALFVLVALSIFELRLIFAEEAHLTAQLGEPYRDYLRTVPRLFPRLRTNGSSTASHPNWLLSVLSELNPIGVFITLAVFSGPTTTPSWCAPSSSVLASPSSPAHFFPAPAQSSSSCHYGSLLPWRSDQSPESIRAYGI